MHIFQISRLISFNFLPENYFSHKNFPTYFFFLFLRVFNARSLNTKFNELLVSKKLFFDVWLMHTNEGKMFGSLTNFLMCVRNMIVCYMYSSKAVEGSRQQKKHKKLSFMCFYFDAQNGSEGIVCLWFELFKWSQDDEISCRRIPFVILTFRGSSRNFPFLRQTTCLFYEQHLVSLVLKKYSRNSILLQILIINHSEIFNLINFREIKENSFMSTLAVRNA